MCIRFARLVGSAAVMLCVLASASTMASASIIGFTISMNGFLDTPPNASTAVGGGIAQFDTATDMISVSVFFAGLASQATASHIHLGAPGVPGGVIVSFVPFTPAATSGSIVGGPLAFPAADIPDLLAGNTYFNIHDAVFPAGEIRGQLTPVPVPEPSTLILAGLGGVGIAARAWKKRRVNKSV